MRFGWLFILPMALVSCVSRYERDFQSAVEVMPESPPSVEGPWVGRWRSDTNGHEGPLWCLVRERDGGGYDFRYRAGWGVMQFGDYLHAIEEVEETESGIAFRGAMDLPGGVGVYDVEGLVVPDFFDAEYRSDRGDHGTIKLRRP